MDTKITRELVYSYLQCKYKGYLKLAGESGTKSDYEILIDKSKEEFKLRATSKILNSFKDDQILQDQDISESILKQEAAIILNAMITNDILSMHIDGLKKNSGESRLGRFHYVPILFHEGEKIHTEQKKLLSLFSLIISNAQGKQPDTGVIVYGKECKITTIKLSNYFREAKHILEDISHIHNTRTAPKLILNNHCRICEFQPSCNFKATKEDDISLLQGISEKEIKKLNKKGIFTINQLSYTFRFRKRGKRIKTIHYPRNFALQALAIREKKIYILGTPSLPAIPVHIYFDVEGDPQKSFVYLIGVLIVSDGLEKQYSLWADNKTQEIRIFQQFIEIVNRYDNYRLFYYGSYELAFLRRMKEVINNKKLVDKLINNSLNILSIIYSTIYFPTYSNGLKEIGKFLGHSWTDENASGIQSIVWRKRWENAADNGFKQKLITYNSEDCTALKLITRCIYELCGEDMSTNSFKTSDSRSIEIVLAKNINPPTGRGKWGQNKFFYPEFEHINKSAYFDYQREKVYIRTSKTIKSLSTIGKKRLKKKKLKANKTIEIKSFKCPFCAGKKIIRNCNKTHSNQAYDLKISSTGIRRQVIEFITQEHRCAECDRSFLPKKFKKRDKHFHALKSWAMYQHIVHRISFQRLEDIFMETFNLRVLYTEIHMIKTLMAKKYYTTYKNLIDKIISGHLIHIDETEINFQKGKGYVWVFTNLEEVVFIYKSLREGDFVKELLKDFKGVLVSDFFGAYDSIPSEQQKCLIHLIRDFNQDLFNNPFDEEFKSLSHDFCLLLRNIISTIDKYGLKHRHLNKHQKDVERFFRTIGEQHFNSETAEQYQKRLIKNQDKLFTFLRHDGVPWNNNNAEHAIRYFAAYRNISDSKMTETGLKDYLILLSIFQTCKYKEISFLKFLLSQEKDIESFCDKGRKKQEVPSIVEIYPDGFPMRYRKKNANLIKNWRNYNKY